MSNIFVTNNSDSPLKDGFAGVQYQFKVGETVEIPVEAAAHIFGYGNDNKELYLARLGWERVPLPSQKRAGGKILSVAA